MGEFVPQHHIETSSTTARVVGGGSNVGSMVGVGTPGSNSVLRSSSGGGGSSSSTISTPEPSIAENKVTIITPKDGSEAGTSYLYQGLPGQNGPLIGTGRSGIPSNAPITGVVQTPTGYTINYTQPVNRVNENVLTNSFIASPQEFVGPVQKAISPEVTFLAPRKESPQETMNISKPLNFFSSVGLSSEDLKGYEGTAPRTNPIGSETKVYEGQGLLNLSELKEKNKNTNLNQEALKGFKQGGFLGIAGGTTIATISFVSGAGEGIVRTPEFFSPITYEGKLQVPIVQPLYEFTQNAIPMAIENPFSFAGGIAGGILLGKVLSPKSINSVNRIPVSEKVPIPPGGSGGVPAYDIFGARMGTIIPPEFEGLGKIGIKIGSETILKSPEVQTQLIPKIVDNLKSSIFAPEGYKPMSIGEVARQNPELAKSLLVEQGQTLLETTSKPSFEYLKRKANEGTLNIFDTLELSETEKVALDNIQRESKNQQFVNLKTGEVKTFSKESIGMTLEELNAYAKEKSGIKTPEVQLPLSEVIPNALDETNLESSPSDKGFNLFGNKKGSASSSPISELFNEVSKGLDGRLKRWRFDYGEKYNIPEIEKAISQTENPLFLFSLPKPEISNRQTSSPSFITSPIQQIESLSKQNPITNLTPISKSVKIPAIANVQSSSTQQVQATTPAIIVSTQSDQAQVQNAVQISQFDNVEPRERPLERTSTKFESTPKLVPANTIPKAFSRKKEEKKRRFIASVRKKGKFVSQGVFDSFDKAFGKGFKDVKDTASASFKVEEEGKGVAQLPIPAQLVNQLYRSKKEKGVFIQPRSKRISTGGEKQEITYKGIRANRMKSGFNRGLKL